MRRRTGFKQFDRVIFRLKIDSTSVLVKGFVIKPWHTTKKGTYYVVDSTTESRFWLRSPIAVNEHDIRPMPKFERAGKSFKEIMNELKVM